MKHDEVPLQIIMKTSVCGLLKHDTVFFLRDMNDTASSFPSVTSRKNHKITDVFRHRGMANWKEIERHCLYIVHRYVFALVLSISNNSNGDISFRSHFCAGSPLPPLPSPLKLGMSHVMVPLDSCRGPAVRTTL
jgi:hypothetical protein